MDYLFACTNETINPISFVLSLYFYEKLLSVYLLYDHTNKSTMDRKDSS